MPVSPAGRAAIMQREGCKLIAYPDSVGVPTIGTGHTGRMSPPLVRLGMTITRAQAEDYLAADLAPVEKAITDFVKVSLAQGERDALASLIFNIGVTGFQGSTVLRKLNKGDRAGAAEAFLMWEKPAVLKSRREAERAQFLAAWHDVQQIASTPDQPVLNAIVSKVNQAAYGAAAPRSRQAILREPAPVASSFWARFFAALKGKPVA